MAILLRVVMLLACGPLLVPPGFCVCNASESSNGVPHRDCVNAENSQYNSGHCSHHHDSIPQSSSEPAQVEEPIDPTPHDHAPGCPAATDTGERTQWVKPTSDSSLVMTVAELIGIVAFPPKRKPYLLNRLASDMAYTPPLYLTYCSLVI